MKKHLLAAVPVALLLLASGLATHEQAPPAPVCVWGVLTTAGSTKVNCFPPNVLGVVGPAGPQGATGAAGSNGAPGAQGPAGPAGPQGAPGAGVTGGGPCSNADGSLGMFVALGNGSCLPVIFSGSTTTAGLQLHQKNIGMYAAVIDKSSPLHGHVDPRWICYSLSGPCGMIARQ